MALRSFFDGATFEQKEDLTACVETLSLITRRSQNNEEEWITFDNEDGNTK
jgi:hypothetical protein